MKSQDPSLDVLAERVRKPERDRESAEAAHRAQNELLADLSHEIRTPMTGILSIVELMLEGAPSRGHQRYLELIQTSTETLLQLLESVLESSRLEGGKPAASNIPFELRSLLADLLAAPAIQAAEKGLSLKCRVGRAVPDRLIGDPIRLRQVLLNLVTNAIKFTAAGQVALAIGLTSKDSDRAVLELTVSDTGPGIPPEQHEAVFQAYKQIESPTTRDPRGVGLGLAISRRLVTLMGGEIQLDASPKSGSIFRLTLPFGLPDSAKSGGAAFRSPSAPEDRGAEELALLDATQDLVTQDFDSIAESGPGKDQQDEAHLELEASVVLVIEDSHVHQVVAKDLLEAWGLDAEIVASGTEAIAALEQSSFDLVLTDFRLPDLDGFDIAAAIRATEKRRESTPGVSTRIPMIAMSASVTPDLPQKCLDAGMDAYVAKPLDKLTLLATIRDVLNPRSPPATPQLAITEAQVADRSEHGTGPTQRPGAFDPELLLRYVGGHPDRARQLAHIFLEQDAPHYITALQDAFAQQDTSALRHAAHGLQGATSGICAWAAAAAAENLEGAAQAQDLLRIDPMYETLRREIQQLTQQLEAFLRG